jgi:glycosyltransferase involved in cell wall biosynthesis
VKDGVNGYLFQPGDPVDAARYMTLLADHPEAWPGMGMASLEKARFHGMEITMKHYEDLYIQLLGTKQG